MLSYPLKLYRGDSYRWGFRLWRDALKTDPWDLSEITPLAEIRTASGAAVIATLPCTVTDNQIDVSLGATECRELPDTAWWDLQLTRDDDDAVQTIVVGAVTVRGDITGSGGA